MWQSRAAAALKEITGFHQSLRVGRNVWGYSPLIQSSCLARVETHIGEIQEEMAKALPITSYFTFIPHNNPEVKVTAPFFIGRIADSGRLS